MSSKSGHTILPVLLAFPLVLAIACGTTNPNTQSFDDGGMPPAGDDDMAVSTMPLPDLTMIPDLTRVRDLVGLIPEPCGNATCAVGQKCCFNGNTGSCMNSCPDGAFSFACYGPQDCSGNPCCVAISGGKPTSLACTKAKTDCVPTLNLVTQSGQTRFCNVDGDCTSGAPGTSLNKCCSGMFMGQPGKICFDPNLAGAANVTCN